MAESNRICSIPGCDKPHEARGWCVRHYKRWKRAGTPFFEEPKAKPTCSHPNCDETVKARGWCQNHYNKWRKTGSPDGHGLTPRGEPERFFKEVVLTHRGDECLLWPYAIGSHGYGAATIDGVYRTVHRAACEYKHGPAPSQDHDAAHRCGVRACCNPKHLRWATHIENEADKEVHGTRLRGEAHPDAVLSEANVREIRRLAGVMSRRLVAKKFGISRRHVDAIAAGRSWAWLEK